MPIIILFIVIAVAVSLAGVFMNPDKNQVNLPEETVQEQQVSGGQSSGQKYVAPKSQPKQQETATIDPNFPLNTYIKYGPFKDDVATNTNVFVFEYDVVVSESVDINDVYFETKVDGIDSNWKRTSQKKRGVKFPGGVKDYTFSVRAKTKSMTEPSPANRTITISISPYFDKLEIDDIDEPGVKAIPSLIEIDTSLASGEKVNITGWKIEGSLGSLTIQKGIEKYAIGSQTAEDVYLLKGDTLFISSETSPFGSVKSSFKTNKCMGYLNNSYDFAVPVKENCPKETSSSISNFLSENCTAYVLSLKTCEESTYQGLVKYDLLSDEYCKGYLNSKFNYQGCLASHSKDSDFLGKEWHIYTSRTEREIMKATHDTVYLKDQNGLFVDKFCYGNPC
ncbi:MAG: hypothetical protein ABH831_02055 [Candidatus Nealsonbacteria bacterium]